MGNSQSKPENRPENKPENRPENKSENERKNKTWSVRDRFKKNLEKQIEVVPIYPSPDAEIIRTQSRRPTKSSQQHVQKIELHAQPISGKNENIVNAVDGRKQVLEPTKWPNSVHGVIAFKTKDITTWGTGVLIGPHIVLTAGHNLYDLDTKAYTDDKSLQFLPGMNGKILPFGVIEVEKYFVSPNYIREGKEDYGILILKKPIGELTGYFGLACLEPEEIKGKRINITGYPGDKVADKSNIYEMWGMEGEASYIGQNHIKYMIDTAAGQSGSGVWYQEGENFYICGVHVAGAQFVNTATLLTRAVYQQIYAWVQQVGFKELLLRLRLRTKMLRLDFQQINKECLSLLTKYDLDDLTSLSLSFAMIRDEELKILAQDNSWINLSQLNLSKNNLDAEGAKALAQNISWINLSQLNLSNNSLGAEGAKSLAENTSWINLSQLDLRCNFLGAEGAKALAENTSWINLSQLDLYDNYLGAEGSKALAQNTSWINLLQLDLRCNYIDAEGVKALAENTSWINLSQLDLSGNSIDAEGVKALAQNTSRINLSQLYLSWNNTGAEGAKALAQNTSWINLSQLDLSGNSIDAEGVKALAENTSWVNLAKLNLYFNSMDSDGAKILKQNKTWKKSLEIGY